MLNGPQRKQRRVDIACGYALGAYLGVVLTWLAILLTHDAALFALLITAVAGLIGTLRVIIGRLPMRFWLIPVASLVYAKVVLISSAYGTVQVAISLGIAFTVVLALPLFRLFKHDFAKTTPPWLCKACGYPLLGLTEPSCPECGKPFDPTNVPKMSKLPQDEGDRLQ